MHPRATLSLMRGPMTRDEIQRARELRGRGIEVGVWVAPLLSGLTRRDTGLEARMAMSTSSIGHSSPIPRAWLAPSLDHFRSGSGSALLGTGSGSDQRSRTGEGRGPQLDVVKGQEST